MQTAKQPTVELGGKGEPVKRAQRALSRTPNPGVTVDGVFGPDTQQYVKDFQQYNSLAVDGIVGPATWAALPDGGPMPVLKEGLKADAVRPLQQALTESAAGQWDKVPGLIDGKFGPQTRASVEAFQKWGRVKVDGVVGDRTWSVPVGEVSPDLEVVVGLQYVVG